MNGILKSRMSQQVSFVVIVLRFVHYLWIFAFILSPFSPWVPGPSAGPGGGGAPAPQLATVAAMGLGAVRGAWGSMALGRGGYEK